MKAGKGQQPRVPASHPLGFPSQSLQLILKGRGRGRKRKKKHLRKVTDNYKNKTKQKTNTHTQNPNPFPSPPSSPTQWFPALLFFLLLCLPPFLLGGQRHDCWRVGTGTLWAEPIFGQSKVGSPPLQAFSAQTPGALGSHQKGQGKHRWSRGLSSRYFRPPTWTISAPFPNERTVLPLARHHYSLWVGPRPLQFRHLSGQWTRR